LKNRIAKLTIAALAAIAVATSMPSSASAGESKILLTLECQGECTVGPIISNVGGHFVDIYVINPYSWPGPGYDCNWTVRDYDTNVVVGSGWVGDEESATKRITGLYGRYTLRISNSQCHGRIDNFY
jgi:hypothetical protein